MPDACYYVNAGYVYPKPLGDRIRQYSGSPWSGVVPAKENSQRLTRLKPVWQSIVTALRGEGGRVLMQQLKTGEDTVQHFAHTDIRTVYDFVKMFHFSNDVQILMCATAAHLDSRIQKYDDTYSDVLSRFATYGSWLGLQLELIESEEGQGLGGVG